MRQGPRDVSLNNIQLVDANHGWTWNSTNNQFQGYFGWYVLEGILIADNLQHRWEIPPSHLFLHPNNAEPVSLTIQPDHEARMTCFSYVDASGARMPAQCRRISDSNYLDVLIQKANHRMLHCEVWEANTILQAVLDEVFLGTAVMPQKRQSMDSDQAHRITQSKLKTIDWGHTQRLLGSHPKGR